MKPNPLLTSLAISPLPTKFGAVLFSGRFEKGLDAAVRHGFNAVELSLRDPANYELHQLEQALNQRSLKLSAIATGQSYLHDDLSLFDLQLEYQNQAVERIKRFIQLASFFQACVIIGGIRGRLAQTHLVQDRQWKAGSQALHECAVFAQELGVTLLLEPINRYETNLINTAQEGLALLERANCPEVKLLLDTFHMNIEEQDMIKTLEFVGARLGYIHFADSNRRAPGQGHVPFPVVLDALRRIGYTGYVSVEILPLPDDESAARQAGEYLGELLKNEI